MKHNPCITNKNRNDAWRMSGSRGELPAVYHVGGASPRMFATRDGPVWIKEKSDDAPEVNTNF